MRSNGELDIPDWLTVFRVPELREPTGISVLGKKIFVADHDANDVLRLDWDGVIADPSPTRNSSTVRDPAQGGLVVTARFSESGSGPLKAPHGVMASETEVLVADTLHHRIARLDVNLNFIGEHSIFSDKRLCRPHAIDSNVPSEIFIADTDNGRLIRLGGDRGEEVLIRGLDQPLCKPCGICLSPNRIFIADTFNHRVVVTNRDGSLVRVYGTEGHRVGMFRYPVAIASWQHWFVVSDEYNKRLQLWRTDEEGDYWTATCVSSNLCAPWLIKPFGVNFNPDGHLFVADRARAQILIVDFERMLAASSYDVV